MLTVEQMLMVRSIAQKKVNEDSGEEAFKHEPILSYDNDGYGELYDWWLILNSETHIFRDEPQDYSKSFYESLDLSQVRVLLQQSGPQRDIELTPEKIEKLYASLIKENGDAYSIASLEAQFQKWIQDSAEANDWPELD